MSKNKVSSGNTNNMFGWGEGFAVSFSTPETLVGSILQIIEAVGLSSGQEVAVKELIKQKIYSIWGENSTYLQSSLYSAIKHAKYEVKKAAEIGGTPVSGVALSDIK